jgi:hypothetical protein
MGIPPVPSSPIAGTIIPTAFFLLFLPPNEKQIDGWPVTIRHFAFVNFSTALPYCF